MQLRDVTHYDSFFEKTMTFDIYNNRFLLFDEHGRRLNKYALRRYYPNYLEIEVLEITKSNYTDHCYMVGFETTHIKLIFFDAEILFNFPYRQSIKYGENEVIER